MSQSLTLEDIAAFGTLEDIDSGNYPQGHAVPNAAIHIDKANQIVAEFREAARHVRASADLTEVGKTSELGRLGAAYLDRLTKLEGYVVGGDKAITRLRSEISVQAPNADQQYVAATIWNHLPLGDALNLKALFMDAIARGEREVFDAVRKLPRFMSPLTDEDVAEGEAAWAERLNPAKATELRETQRAVATAKTAVSRARSIIEKESRIGKNDPISKTARVGTG